MEEYDVLFTAGATQSLKLVAEWFQWEDSTKGHPCIGHFVYSQDNHTSVLGLREIVAQQRGVHVHCLEHEDGLEKFRKPLKNQYALPHMGNALFVYSAQCNFSGCKYPLDWIKKVHHGALDEFVNKRIGTDEKRWFCLLDAASYIPTNGLNLQTFKPDFVAMSFYKIFGYPTGIGALLVRKPSGYILNKKYFGGGTVTIALSNKSFHRKKDTLHERCEDGTINFLSILSLRHCFDSLRMLGGTMDQISNKVFHLAQYLHGRLLMLHHSNGNPVAMIYRDTDYTNVTTQGGVVNFNLLRSTGKHIGYVEVLNAANLYGIYLRSGCFCNPGACQRHLNLTDNQLLENFQRGHTCNDDIDLIDGYPTGSVRASFGYTSKKEDADKLIEMIMKCFVSQPAIIKIPTDWTKTALLLRNKFEHFNHSENRFTRIENQITKHRLEIFEKFNRDYRRKEFIARKMGNSGNLKLSEAFIYPVKSCSAFIVSSEWPIIETGLKYDREWMVVSAEGVALTQKRIPKLCLIVPNIDTKNRVLSLEYRGENKSVNASIHIPLDAGLEESSSSPFPAYYSKVCSDSVMVYDCGGEIARWLQFHLEVPDIRLVRLKNRKKSKKGVVKTTRQSEICYKIHISIAVYVRPFPYKYDQETKNHFFWCSSLRPVMELCDSMTLEIFYSFNFALEDSRSTILQLPLLPDSLTVQSNPDSWTKFEILRRKIALPRIESKICNFQNLENLGTLHFLDKQLSLTNRGQYLLITESSAKWIQEKTGHIYSLRDIMRQFRSNFIISGNMQPLVELEWKEVAIGNYRFKVDEPCRRCNIICIDQSSGEKKKELLTTLATELNGKNVFGVYISLITADSASTIAIGLPVVPKFCRTNE